jgi:hypothetical protein
MSRQHETACTLTKTCLVFSGSKHGIFSQVPTKSFSRPVFVSSFINRAVAVYFPQGFPNLQKLDIE